MMVVVVPVIQYICLCSQSGRNWKNKSKIFEYLDPVYELIDAKKCFWRPDDPRHLLQVGWFDLPYKQTGVPSITSYIFPPLNDREPSTPSVQFDHTRDPVRSQIKQ